MHLEITLKIQNRRIETVKTVKLTAETQKDLLNTLLKRSPNNYTQYEETVAEIVGNVRENGNKAVFEYTKEFDKWDINETNIRVSESEIEEAYSKTDAEFIDLSICGKSQEHSLQQQRRT